MPCKNSSASHVDERIEEFLRQFDERLAAVTEAELEARVQSLIKLKQVPDVSLDEEVSRNWNEILSEEYLFDRLSKEVPGFFLTIRWILILSFSSFCDKMDHLRGVRLEEIRSFYRHHALPSSDQRRKLSMQARPYLLWCGMCRRHTFTCLFLFCFFFRSGCGSGETGRNPVGCWC